MDLPSTRINEPYPQYGPIRARKTFVLCFDGTGNKFSGSDGDSNIIKIYRMLDRSDPNQLHYYQVRIQRSSFFQFGMISYYLPSLCRVLAALFAIKLTS